MKQKSLAKMPVKMPVKMSAADGGKIASGVPEMLRILGEDPTREGLVRTPERWERAMQYLTSGYNGGSWNGPGIMSTDSQTLSNGLAYALGVADYAQAPGFVPGLSSNQIEIKYTLVGDLDLNSFVNGIDFARLAQNFNDFDTNWVDGNLIYGSSIINGIDFSQLAKNFGHIATTGASVTLSAADWAVFDAFEADHGVGAAVPEPASAAIFALSGAALLARRRKRALHI